MTNFWSLATEALSRSDEGNMATTSQCRGRRGAPQHGSALSPQCLKDWELLPQIIKLCLEICPIYNGYSIYVPCVKETIILTLVTTRRQTLCRIIVMSIGTTSVGLCSKGDVGFNFKYSKERREGIYSQRVGWVSGGNNGWKITKRKYQG